MPSNHEPDDFDDPVAPADELDVIFDVLRNRRRRFVIRVLSAEGTTSLDALAANLADATDSATKTAKISLYQHHLPRMDDADVVVWDRDGGQVAPGPDFQKFLGYIREDDGG